MDAHDGPLSPASIPLFLRGAVNYRQGHVLETFREVHVFADSNPAVAGSTIASSRRSLDDVVLQLSSHLTAQESGEIANRAAKARQRTLRSNLRRDHMRSIAEVAKQKLRDVAEFHSRTIGGGCDTNTSLPDGSKSRTSSTSQT